MRFLGADLAWAQRRADGRTGESGVASLAPDGTLLDAGWRVGVAEVARWAAAAAGGGGALLAVDAPLVVTNPVGQRRCDTEVGRRYGRWKVSANTVNLASRHLAGVALLAELERAGWRYTSGRSGPPAGGRTVFECYPYTTLVGAPELGYAAERPRYKRRPKGLPAGAWRPARARACDELVARLAGLAAADPPLRLASHPAGRALLDEPAPLADAAYKHREDLIDALLCAWTAALWARHGARRCQVLGAADAPQGGRPATIIAPARAAQRG